MPTDIGQTTPKTKLKDAFDYNAYFDTCNLPSFSKSMPSSSTGVLLFISLATLATSLALVLPTEKYEKIFVKTKKKKTEIHMVI